MPGVIGFEKLRIRCIIGTEPKERQTEQEILVDLKVEPKSEPAVDCLQETIDYVALADTCQSCAREGRYFLLEKYAADVCSRILTLFPVERVWVRVEKPSALKDAAFAFVELRR